MIHTSANILIREFTEDDAVAVSRLIGHTMLTTNVRDYRVERLRELAEWFSSERVVDLNTRRRCLVAEQDQAILGTIAYEEPVRDGDMLVTTLATFFTSPAAQGQGIGSSLLEHLEQLARRDGITLVHLEASLAGQSFYAAHGFVPTGQIVHGHAGEHMQMTKRLS